VHITEASILPGREETKLLPASPAFSFFKYTSSKRKTRDNVGPLLNEVGVLMMEDAAKAELLNACFSSVFSAKFVPQETQALEEREEACIKG